MESREIELRELIKVESRPAILDANFDALRAEVSKRLEKYAVVVTEDGLKDAKALATELNATKTALNRCRIDEAKKAAEPIDKFQGQMNELTNMVEDGRKKILDQVEKFESGKVEKARELLADYLVELYELYKIRAEYRTASVLDFAKVSALTGKGKLNKAARDKVSAEVEKCRARQQMVDLRISQLENASHRAGLHSPLTREHIAGILEAPEEQYQAELQRLLGRELERQQETLDKAKAAREAEAEKAADAVRAAEAESAKGEQSPSPEAMGELNAAMSFAGGGQCMPPAPENGELEYYGVDMGEGDSAATLTHGGPAGSTLPAEPNPAKSFTPAKSAEVDPLKVAKVVTATFEIQVAPHISHQKIEAELRRKMEAAGISTLQAISIVEKFDF